MTYSFNAEIETLLSVLKVPYNFMFYEGADDTYITYQKQSADDALAGDDQVIGDVVYYDVDIYSRGNYLTLIDSVITLFEGAGWTYQPSRESPDMYETDTKYFHRTLCFARPTN